MGRPKAIRVAAWGVVAAGVAAPLVRRRLGSRTAAQALAYAAPLALSVAVRRSRARDVGVCALQMWAYVAAYEAPHDDPEHQLARTHFTYPIVADRVLGLGELPTIRLQRSFGPHGAEEPRWRKVDAALVWAHWLWFLVPHSALAYILLRRPERFPRAALLTYAVFDVGACFYWIVPTAPPWYVAMPPIAGGAISVGAAEGAEAGRIGGETDRRPASLEVRRMMVEYGEGFWQDGWGPMFDALGGNPLAAMPSLHCATSVMAAILLSELGPVHGAVGWGYAAFLSFSLVYLGEHYVVDLIAGLALTGAVYRAGPQMAPLAERARGAVRALEARAHGG
ncbi:MAG: phosphatase PAP2 family protein [Acidobacteriota bacterium]|nr:phosphatase PAP2 family protein [Acidobacteriota bacterium]